MQHRKFAYLTKWLRRLCIGGLILLQLWLVATLAVEFFVQRQIQLPGADGSIELYSNQAQDDLTKLYQQAIEGAQNSITLAIYSLKDEAIIQSLQKQSETGINVHIVCDAEASAGIARRLPHAEIICRHGNGLMHQKILIVDESSLWLGSANLTPGSLRSYGNLVVGLNHPPMAKILTQRAKSMDEEGAYLPLGHKTTTAASQQVELWVLPDDQKAVKRMLSLIRTAKKSIKVAMYTWTRQDFAHELIAAAKRGVQVEAVIDRNQGQGSGAKIVRLLENNGIPVTLNTGQGLLHHKFAYIDDTILVNGSANWTERAFTKNDDYFLVIYPLTAPQQKKLNQIFKVVKEQSEKPRRI